MDSVWLGRYPFIEQLHSSTLIEAVLRSYSPFLNWAKAIVTPKLMLHLGVTGEYCDRPSIVRKHKS